MRAVTLLPALLLAACGGSAGDPPPAWQTLPVAACGMPPYALLDPATLGEVRASEENALLELDRATLQSMLEKAGWKDLGTVQYGTRVLRFRYTTQDRGQPVEATATLGIPQGVLPESLPVTLFLHGTTGFADACAPSRDLDGQAAAALVASLGFVAVLPDYIGLNGFGAPSTARHGYLVGEQVALGSWDALRAGLKLLAEEAPEVVAEDRVVVWGGSQGGHAALFAELYAPYYAPEFEVPAVVALVPPSVLLPLAKLGVTEWGPPTLAFGAVVTTMREWYGGPADLSGVLTDVAPYHFASTFPGEVYVENECATAAAYQAITRDPEQQRIEEVYRPEFIGAVVAGGGPALDPWLCYFEENSVATSSVKPLRHIPTLMVYSELDDLVVTAPQREDFDRLCSLGYELEFLECAGAGHSQGAAWSMSEQLGWIEDRLAGKPVEQSCERRVPICCSGTPAARCGG